MAIELRWQQQHAFEAEVVRRQAGALLDRLVSSREATEQHSAETGRPDPMKQVTGSTALDGAISMTRKIVLDTDELLREMESDQKAFVQPTGDG